MKWLIIWTMVVFVGWKMFDFASTKLPHVMTDTWPHLLFSAMGVAGVIMMFFGSCMALAALVDLHNRKLA